MWWSKKNPLEELGNVHYVNQSRGEAGVEAANGENIVALQSV